MNNRLIALAAGFAVAAPAVAAEIDEIVVTARKRIERALDVPIAVSVFSGDAIERRGAGNLADFLQEAPGVGIYDNGDGVGKLTIRGISTSIGANENGFYIDDLPFTGVTTPIIPDVRAWDLERVEVLRGPQGTLFGEGSMGGTVRILTQGPDLANWQAKGLAFVSDTDGGGTNGGFKGAFNAPLIEDVLAVRIAGTHERYAGWLDDRATDRRNVNDQTAGTLRARVRFDPVERLSINGSYMRYSADFPGGNALATDDGQVSQTTELASTTKYELYGASARYDLGGAALFYGYSHNDLDITQDDGEIVAAVGIKVEAHEARLSSTGTGPLQWTVGAYQRKSSRADIVDFPAPMGRTAGTTSSTARAAFGETTYTLPGIPIELTAGLRYFEDKLRGTQLRSGVTTLRPGDNFHSVNPRFSVAWHPQPNATLYASAAKGFRSGQLQPTVSLAVAERFGFDLPESVREDSIWTYEVGAKAQLFDDRISVEGAVYRSVWDNVAVVVPIGDTGFTGIGTSDGTRTWGGEISIIARPVTGLTLGVGASYVDAEFAGDVGGLPLGGARVDEVPRFSANASADYRRPLARDLTGVARIAWQHSSPRSFESDPLAMPGDTIDRIDARLGVEFETVALAVFADNLTNENGAVSYRSSEEVEPGIEEVISNRLRPRTIGIEASFKFGGPR